MEWINALMNKVNDLNPFADHKTNVPPPISAQDKEDAIRHAKVKDDASSHLKCIILFIGGEVMEDFVW